jgi:hypothetical protein
VRRGPCVWRMRKPAPHRMDRRNKTRACWASAASKKNRRGSAGAPSPTVFYLKSSGETRFIQSLNLSTTSSSGASSIASSKTTAASSITSSAA